MYLSFITILLALVLSFYNWNINRNIIFLSLFLISLSLYSLTHYLLLYTEETIVTAILYNNFVPFYLLSGPFFYFYVRSILTDSQQISRKDFWHFIPALVSLVNVTPYIFTSFAFKIEIVKAIEQYPNIIPLLPTNLFLNASFNVYVRSGLLIFYTLFVLAMLFRYIRKNNNQEHLHLIVQQRIIFRWIFSISLFTLISCITYLIIVRMLLNGSSANLLKENPHPIYIINIIAFIMIPVSLFLFPQVLYGIPIARRHRSPKRFRTAEVVENGGASGLISGAANASVQMHGEKEEAADDQSFVLLAKDIMDLLTLEKQFINPDFSIEDLAISLNVPKRHIYYCFNYILKIKFIQLRTQLRVKHATELLDSGTATLHTIDTVGFKSGFSSRTSFFRTFKAETGLTPGEYLEKKVD